MPVSNTRRKKKPAVRRIHIKRTAGWALLNESYNAIAAIMLAIRSHATICVDAKTIGLSENDQDILNKALGELKATMVINDVPQTTVTKKAELHYSKAVGLVESNPYLKERQIADDVSVLSQLLDHVVGNSLPFLGVVSDILITATELTPHHEYLMRLANDAMARMSKQSPAKSPETTEDE